jgi:hypothetical protein
MSVRTVQELREWLQERGDDGERVIQNDWWVWTNASGDICVQHPSCPDMSGMFCCDGRQSHPRKETTNAND